MTTTAALDNLEEYARENVKASIFPELLTFGVVAIGFLYSLRFSVQNNTTTPMRMRVKCASKNPKERNSLRLMELPDIVAPGLVVHLHLELTAEFATASIFEITVSQNHSSETYSKLVRANVVSTETFKHVKKSLQLQKRPIYDLNVRVIANIPEYEMISGELHNHSSATFSEAALLDDEDIDELLSYPMAPNVYWDPFAKCLRIDPTLGRVS